MFHKASLKYLDAIIEIENSVFEQPWSKVHFLKDLELNVSYNIVCIKKTECIGYLFGYLIEKDYHLNNIAVKQICQGKGIAKDMLKFLIKKLRKSKINKIMLEVRCDNFQAIKLYDSMGFNKVNIRKNYYKKGKDAFLYDLHLN
tara:strand:+ start:2910 stop:3341 length:432 start_codon:yes stop_codon:yes gene_type:complete